MIVPRPRRVGLPPGKPAGGTSVLLFLLLLTLVSPPFVARVDAKKILPSPPPEPKLLCGLNVVVCGSNGLMYPCREMAPAGMATTTNLAGCRPPGNPPLVTPTEVQCPVKSSKVCASNGRIYPCADVAPKGLLTTTDLTACQTPATCPWSTSAYSKASLALLANECSTLARSPTSSSSLIGCCAATSALLQSTAIATAKAKLPRVNTPAVFDARAGQCLKQFVPFIQGGKAAAAATTAPVAAAAVLFKYNPVMKCAPLGFGAAQFGLEGGKGACRGITTDAQLTSALKASPVWWVSSYMRTYCSSTMGNTGRCLDCAKQVSTLFDALIRPGDTVPQKQRCWGLISYYVASLIGNSTAHSMGIAFCLHKNAPYSLLPPGTTIKTVANKATNKPATIKTATIKTTTIKTSNGPTIQPNVKPSIEPANNPSLKATFEAANSQPMGDTIPRQQVPDASLTFTFHAAADTSAQSNSAHASSVRSTSATAVILASVALMVLLAAVVAAAILAVRGGHHHMHRQRLASSSSGCASQRISSVCSEKLFSASEKPTGYVSGSASGALSAGVPLKASVSGSSIGSSGVSDGGGSREGSVSSTVGLMGHLTGHALGAASDAAVASKVPVAPPPVVAAAAAAPARGVTAFVAAAFTRGAAAAPSAAAVSPRGAAGAAAAAAASPRGAAASTLGKPVTASRFVMDATAAAPAQPPAAEAAAAKASGATATGGAAAAPLPRKPSLPFLASALATGTFASSIHSPVRRRAGVFAPPPPATSSAPAAAAKGGGEK
ncbi:hypothetical protein CLOP_g10487 [Closterium sp. NIES-67]|nr:hypothetical protein CLOP_g10487 [Closterium sp. NIES-67]